MKQSGIELIAIEREEQFKKHGRTISNDAIENPYRELARGASALLKQSPSINDFPKHWDESMMAKWTKKTYKERLIIAGALICAEIDRIQLYDETRTT